MKTLVLATVIGLTALAAPAMAQVTYGDRYDDDGYRPHIVTNTPNVATNTNGVQSSYYAAMDDRMAYNDRYDRDWRDRDYDRYQQHDRYVRDNGLVDDADNDRD